ncbi:MAG TPA: DUF763 domain-containing protein [Candidatus Korarchaeota archaeon]|nr:DUF763 domain-containing protein [Candidatus Korarchaeota archaeon]
MKRTGEAYLPLHGGKAPAWLFRRMKELAKPLLSAVVSEYGRRGLLERLSDPCWFQALGCALGYDWHSSGVTTVLTAALKEALEEAELGVRIAGGKGKTSLKTPEELGKIAQDFGLDPEPLVRTSRLVAKVDNAALQDGYDLYHHSFILTEEGEWAVVQQGMDPRARMARRYHWLGSDLRSFVVEPHRGIVTEVPAKQVLNLVAVESEGARRVSLDLVREGPRRLRRLMEEYRVLKMPRRIDWNALKRAYQLDPSNYEELLQIKGIGKAAVRALALLSELVYGEKVSVRDPAKYSFAFGGKDGVPFPVDLRLMDEVISYLRSSELPKVKVNLKGGLSKYLE